MSTQQQIQPPYRRKRSSWKLLRLILAIITVLFIGVGTTIAIFLGTLFNTVSIIFAAAGAAFALCQWLLPVSHTQSNHPTPSISPSSMPPIIIQVPGMQTTPVPQAPPLAKNVDYRGIIGLPPPTEPRTIQQREQDIREVYTLLTQPDVTAVVLTGIGGVGKSTLAALVFRYAEEQRRMRNGLFTGEAIWLRVDPSVTLSELASNLFEALGVTPPEATGTPQKSGIWDVPVTMDVKWEFKDPDWTLTWSQPGKPRMGASWGAQYYGDKDSLIVTGGDSGTGTEEKAMNYAPPAGGVAIPPSPGHREDWIHAIRTRGQTIMPIEAGVHAASLGVLGNLSYTLGRKLAYDPKSERFVDDEEANRLLFAPYRYPWKLS